MPFNQIYTSPQNNGLEESTVINITQPQKTPPNQKLTSFFENYFVCSIFRKNEPVEFNDKSFFANLYFNLKNYSQSQLGCPLMLILLFLNFTFTLYQITFSKNIIPNVLLYFIIYTTLILTEIDLRLNRPLFWIYCYLMALICSFINIFNITFPKFVFDLERCNFFYVFLTYLLTLFLIRVFFYVLLIFKRKRIYLTEFLVIILGIAYVIYTFTSMFSFTFTDLYERFIIIFIFSFVFNIISSFLNFYYTNKEKFLFDYLIGVFVIYFTEFMFSCLMIYLKYFKIKLEKDVLSIYKQQ
ncbi:hypothetical protein TUBRATIS_25530 [Tubulinosema ratisbonensis]|uniref:Uncharacterized protein n=1 Tax=Tubulinosema ratisbonensis TaxID=291195 RepID=A0A437AIX0_9MICR|nr:hypothetical protein TUBRATIS_25530 [Tubulinosema ratisbonensis]